MTPEFERDGAAHFSAVVTAGDVAGLAEKVDRILAGRPGARVTDPALCENHGVWGAVRDVAVRLIGREARPVRVLAFDKTSATNWALPWHQDRTIAVRERIETPGYGPWSVKDGVPHVEPPTALLTGMVTLRLHVDDCGADNAPLQVALGSHRLGLVPADQAALAAGTLPQLACQAGAGDIWAYSTLILHRSERSRIKGRRRVVQVDYSKGDLAGELSWDLGGLS